MTEQSRAMGLGFAIVDEKVKGLTRLGILPKKREGVEVFLDNHQKIIIAGAGGSIANAMSTYADFIEAGKASLFCYIGEDPYCSVFRRETSDKLGEPQVDGTKPTGLAVFIIDDEGTTTHELIFYDATESVQIPRDRVQKGETDLFVTNVDLCNRPDLLHRVLEALKKLGKNTIFSLSLDGSLVIRTPKSRLSPKKSAYKKIPLLFTV